MKKLKLNAYVLLFRITSFIGFFFMNISQKAMHEANLLLPEDPESPPKSSFSEFIKDMEKK